MIQVQSEVYGEKRKVDFMKLDDAIDFALKYLAKDIHFPEFIMRDDKYIWKYDETGIDGLVRLKDSLYGNEELLDKTDRMFRRNLEIFESCIRALKERTFVNAVSK